MIEELTQVSIQLLMIHPSFLRYSLLITNPVTTSSPLTQDTHARFILASDGFWDVVSVDTVRCVGLSEKYK
jgi:serine/threonine protein phosphatase PrpC